MAFLVYIKDKNVEDCDGMERFVWEKIKELNIEFFPEAYEEDVEDN
jgi:hypothetical protein